MATVALAAPEVEEECDERGEEDADAYDLLSAPEGRGLTTPMMASVWLALAGEVLLALGGVSGMAVCSSCCLCRVIEWVALSFGWREQGELYGAHPV